jgi:hypothetical protein
MTNVILLYCTVVGVEVGSEHIEAKTFHGKIYYFAIYMIMFVLEGFTRKILLQMTMNPWPPETDLTRTDTGTDLLVREICASFSQTRERTGLSGRFVLVLVRHGNGLTFRKICASFSLPKEWTGLSGKYVLVLVRPGNGLACQEDMC